jgi:hypothetical protein
MSVNTSTVFVEEELRNILIDRFTPAEFVELMGFSMEEVVDAFSEEISSRWAEIDELVAGY